MPKATPVMPNLRTRIRPRTRLTPPFEQQDKRSDPMLPHPEKDLIGSRLREVDATRNEQQHQNGITGNITSAHPDFDDRLAQNQEGDRFGRGFASQPYLPEFLSQKIESGCPVLKVFLIFIWSSLASRAVGSGKGALQVFGKLP